MIVTPRASAQPVGEFGPPRATAIGPTAPSHAASPTSPRLDWIEAAKAFALIGILLNHFVESFAAGPWFTNPDNHWPSLTTRLHTFFPSGPNPLVAALRFAGWLGDAGPGVFIFASGLGLTLSSLARAHNQVGGKLETGAFYRRRLTRLYPLYIAMHFVILALALAIPGELMTFGSPTTLLSASGLRFLPSLFFAISPSWWFVWLILQLYVTYPFLWRMAQRLGPGQFFAASVVFTIASRAIGIGGSTHRYFWLTGMFFGSRLAEFTAGMVAAMLITGAWRPARGLPTGAGVAVPPSTRWIVGSGLACYVAGLGASFFLWGALVSNLLVTLGLIGLFYGIWQLVQHASASMARAVVWLGGASYAVFLLHQPLIRWASTLLHAHVALHAVVGASVLLLAVPGAVAIERGVAWVERDLAPWMRARRTLLSWALGLTVPLVLFVVEPHLLDDSRPQRALCLVLAAVVIATGWLEWTASAVMSGRAASPASSPSRDPFVAAWLRRTALVSAFATLFILPSGFGYLAALGGALTGLAVTLLSGERIPLAWSWASGIAVTGLVLALGEVALKRYAPTEAGGWGERAALTVHPTRAFGLIPNRVTHLRYNDYDYTVRTNSLGLPGPEIAPVPTTPSTWRLLAVGDAFTMPEGLDYEQSYPALMNAALRQCSTRDTVQVIDGGVTGYGPNEEGPEIRELLPLLNPNVVVYQFFVNEWSDIQVDSAARRQGIGLESSHRGRAEMLSRSQLVTHLAEDYDAGMSRLRGRLSQRQRWKLLLDYYRRGPNGLYDAANVARMSAFLTSIRDAARAQHADLVIAFVPGAVQASRPTDVAYLPASGIPLSDPATYDLDRPLGELRPLAAAAGLPIVDLTDSLRNHRPQPVYYRNAWHWNAEGHRAATGALLSVLRQRNDLPPGC